MTDKIRQQIAMLQSGSRKDIVDVAFHAARSMEKMLAVVEAAKQLPKFIADGELSNALAALDGES